MENIAKLMERANSAYYAERGKHIYADFKTFHPLRKKPAKPVETYTGKILQPEDYIDQPIHTEDYATILLHYENGVRGVLTVSQVSSGLLA